MLARNEYPREHIDQAQARVAAQVAAFRAAADAAGAGALADLEPVFFNALVIELEAFFMHRTRKLEGKDGNPLNEVRMLAASLTAGEVLVADSTIKYDPAAAVLGVPLGGTIAVDAGGFERLAKAFFAEIDARFT